MPIINPFKGSRLPRTETTSTNAAPTTKPTAAVPETRPHGNVFVPAAAAARGTFSAAQLGAASELLKAGGGPSSAADAAKFLAANPQLAARLERYSALLVSAHPAERTSIAMRALRSAVMDGSAPMPALRGINGDKLLNDYARDLGIAGVQKRQGRVTANIGGKVQDLGPVGASLADLGRAMSFARYGAEGVVPPHSPLVRDANEFSIANAHLATHLSELAYGDEASVRTQLEAMGFDMRTFSWINDAATDTQGFVVANKDGNVFTNFRGTASKTDLATDGKFLRVTPSWADGTVSVHSGFSTALDAVWPQVEAAVAKARKVTGKDAPMIATGHSLGGALAQLAALRAVKTGMIDGGRLQAYTIGSPRVGNAAFAEQIEAEIRGNYRVVNYRDSTVDQQDLVTQVPPKYLGYEHGGTLIRLDQDGYQVIAATDRRAGMEEPGTAAARTNDTPSSTIEAMSEDQIRALMASEYAAASAPVNESGFAVSNILFHKSVEYLERVSTASLRPNLARQEPADGLWR